MVAHGNVQGVRMGHNYRPVVAGFSGLGQSSLMQQFGSGQLTVNLAPTVDLTNCDAATIAAYNAGLIPDFSGCAAPASGGPTTTQIPTWLWIALAAIVVLMVTRR